MTFKMRICIFVLLSNIGLYLTNGQTTEPLTTSVTTDDITTMLTAYTTMIELTSTTELTSTPDLGSTTELTSTTDLASTTELTSTPELTSTSDLASTTETSEPTEPKANDCRTSKSFVCQYGIEQQHDDDCETVVKTAYIKSFLNPDMMDPHCDCNGNPIKCEITTGKAYCENTMLIAFVNGITLMDDINDTIIFETIRVEDKRIDFKVAGLIILAVFAFFLIFTIFIIIVKKRNHRRKNGGCKAKPMKKMTMRQTIKTWFYIKDTKMNRNVSEQELTTVEDKSYDNNGAVGEDVENVEITSDEGVITEVKQVDEREAAPLPIERPKETLPRPNPHNSYLGLDEIKDPIYVNQKVLQP